MQQEEEILHKRKDMMTHYPAYEGKRSGIGLEAMISKIHEKQEDAWRRVKRQEEDIQRRNMDSRMRRTGFRTYYSPNQHHTATRTFYSPNR